MANDHGPTIDARATRPLKASHPSTRCSHGKDHRSASVALSPEESRQRSNEGHPRLQHHHCPPPSSDWQIASIALPTLHPTEPPLPFRQISSDLFTLSSPTPGRYPTCDRLPSCCSVGVPLRLSHPVVVRHPAPAACPSSPPIGPLNTTNLGPARSQRPRSCGYAHYLEPT